MDGFIEVLYAQDRQNRAEDFFLDYSRRAFIDVHQQCRQIEIPFREGFAHRALSPNENARAALHGISDLLFHFVALRSGVEGSNDDALLDSVSDAELFRFYYKLGHELVVDLVKQIEPLDREACLAAVEKAADRRGTNSLVEIRVIAHDHRIAATELQGDALHILRGNFHDVLAGRCGTRKSDLPHARIFQQRFADDPRGSRHDVQHTRRKPRLVQNVYSLNVRQRRRCRRLHDDTVSGDQRGPNLIAQKRNGKIPGHDRAADTDRLLDDHSVTPIIERRHITAANALGETGVVFQCVRETPDLEDRFTEWLALLLR